MARRRRFRRTRPAFSRWTTDDTLAQPAEVPPEDASGAVHPPLATDMLPWAVPGATAEPVLVYDPGEGYDPDAPATWDPDGSPQTEPPPTPPTTHPPTSEDLPNGKKRKTVRWDAHPNAKAYDVEVDGTEVVDVGYATQVSVDLDSGQGMAIRVRGRNSQGPGPYSGTVPLTAVNGHAWATPTDLVAVSLTPGNPVMLAVASDTVAYLHEQHADTSVIAAHATDQVVSA